MASLEFMQNVHYSCVITEHNLFYITIIVIVLH